MVDTPLIFADRHYSVTIVFDEGRPYWGPIPDSSCRCGRAACENCGNAFNSWFIEQARTLFGTDPEKLYFVSFQIRVHVSRKFSAASTGIWQFKEQVVATVNEVLPTGERWLGVMDARGGDYYSAAEKRDWGLADDDPRDRGQAQKIMVYAFLISGELSRHHIRTINKKFIKNKNVLRTIDDWDRNPRSHRQLGIESNPVIPNHYAYWRDNFGKGALTPQWRRVREELLATVLHSDRLVLVNLRREGDTVVPVD